jgi:predicted amidohydrolase
MAADSTERSTTLTVALVQLAASLDPADNRAALSVVGDVVRSDPRPGLVVLPEAFARDFGKPGSDVSAYAEPLDGPFVAAVAEQAGQHGVTVVAGMFETSEDPARPYNTLVVLGPDGELRASYRKIHLYDSFGYKESDRLVAGAVDPVLVDVEGVRVGLTTCYDLRFPELTRVLAERGAELVLVPAAWVAGERKVEHWRTLVAARAIENTVYVAAVGQPAPRYTGHSLVVAPSGDVLAETDDADGRVVTATVDLSALGAVRRTNPSLLNRRLKPDILR